jgi:hypothetical protein
MACAEMPVIIEIHGVQDRMKNIFSVFISVLKNVSHPISDWIHPGFLCKTLSDPLILYHLEFNVQRSPCKCCFVFDYQNH